MVKSEQKERVHIKALFARALEHHQASNLDAAKKAYQEILELDPSHLAANGNLATIFAQSGALEAALPMYERVIALRPDHLDAYNNKALCLKKLERHEEALGVYDQVIAVAGDNSMALEKKGLALEELDRSEEALECYDQALAIDPSFVGAQVSRGNLLQDLGQPEAARECFEKLLSASPRNADEMIGKAVAQQKLGKSEDAIKTCRAALELDPLNGDAHANLGVILKDLGCHEEAMSVYDKAMELNLENKTVRFNRAIQMLTMGRFEEGWKEFEWRLKRKGVPKPQHDIPRWQGEDLNGKRIYVEAEQGFGDIIQFLRYIEPLKKAGATIIFGGARRLVPLSNLVSGIDERVTQGDAIPRADYYSPLMSLPFALKDAPPGTVPVTIPYMKPIAGLVEKWRKKLPQGEGLRVGIAWQGNPSYYYDYVRSIPLRFFAPLIATEAVQFFNLQKGFGAGQLESCGFGNRITDFGDELDAEAGPFMDTAAILANLDLVIASDSAVPHLAGAMGLPVWMLVSTPADWRWGLEGEQTCWYPGMRLFRQKKTGSWRELMERVQKELLSLLEERSDKG